MGVRDPSDEDDYLSAEARARVEIDKQLAASGWKVQSQKALNLSAGPGVVIREFTLEKPHGRVDYLLFLNGQPAGVIEAKPEGTTLVEVEHQSGKYVEGLPAWMQPPVYPLPFIYESTGTETRLTNGHDPDARSRRVSTFHRPETLIEWLRQITDNPDLPTFRARLRAMPPLDERGLWGKQAEAIRNLEESLANDQPRSLIQMATGSGKTFTAANACYRLIKHADAKRVLFLVDRSNLGKQAKLEFDKFTIPETQRKFPAEYNVQHLTHNAIDATSRVCISTVQRIFSILKGEAELDQEMDEQSVYELHVSHWTGSLAAITVYADWAWGGRFQQLFGQLTYGGQPVYGFSATSVGNPTDSYGRNLYLDTFDSPYGAGWKRENSFLAQYDHGAFCYSFGSRPPYPGYPKSPPRAGPGKMYRLTVLGPGVTPAVMWQGPSPGNWDGNNAQDQAIETKADTMKKTLNLSSTECHS